MADVQPWSRPLTECEAAKRLDVSVDTVRRERKRGRIRYTMVAGRPSYGRNWVMAV